MQAATDEEIANLKLEVLQQLAPLLGQEDASLSYIQSLPPKQFVHMMKNMATSMPLETMRCRIREQFGTDELQTEHLYKKIEDVYAFLQHIAV